jgi:hypothetical protein
MALSNWDAFAMNHKGEPCDGTFTAPSRVRIEIRKNWIYISDKKIWDDTCIFTKPIVMKFTHGAIEYKDITLVAKIGNKNGIYFAIWSGYDGLQEDPLKGMVGIGCYAYKGNRCVGVEKKEVDVLQKFLSSENFDIPDSLRNLPLDKGKRFNQGDCYFAGVDTSLTDVGKAENTIFSQIIEKM